MVIIKRTKILQIVEKLEDQYWKWKKINKGRERREYRNKRR